MNPLEAYSDPTCIPATEPRRLARLLNLDEREHLDEVSFARRVAAGIADECRGGPWRAPRRKRIEGRVVSEATVHRHRKSGKALSRSHSERVYALVRVLDAEAGAFHGDVARIDDFLNRPHPLLDGEAPLEMAISSSAGADAVLNLVRRAQAGVAV